MTDFKAKMHQLWFRLGLRPRPRWGSLQRSPRPPSWIWGAASWQGEGRGGRGKWMGGKGRAPMLLLNQGPSELCYATVLRCNMMTSQQIQYGGRPPYWKSSFGYISAIYCPFNAKFCMKKQNHVQTQVTWPKYQILKIQEGGRPPFWKWFYRYISTGNHLISMKFGVQTQILVPRMVTCWFIKNTISKIVCWLYLHELLSD